MITLSVVNSGEHWNSMMALDALLTYTERARNSENRHAR